MSDSSKVIYRVITLTHFGAETSLDHSPLLALLRSSAKSDNRSLRLAKHRR